MIIKYTHSSFQVQIPNSTNSKQYKFRANTKPRARIEKKKAELRAKYAKEHGLAHKDMYSMAQTARDDPKILIISNEI
jgi:hypothetical protein